MRGSLPALVFFLLFSSFCPAQETPATTGQPTPATKPRLKIGVALEGGGALGLAHIGVLQWFEDHHIPIDYLAGTSMGGLVGGLYSTGKTPQQLRELVDAQNWDVILGGGLPYEDLSFRRKEDQVAFPNSIVLGLRRGLVLPGGLNAGQQISLLIDRETLAYSGVQSFDNLPIPFRCVATDLVTGKQAVFKEGSLSQAMRATMAIPGLFSPIREGEHIYVDGGLVGNLPTDVVRDMGADIVIGVHLQTSPAEAEKIQSLFAILGRSIDVVVAGNEIRGLAGADLVVNVGLQDFNSLEYDEIERDHCARDRSRRPEIPPARHLRTGRRCLGAIHGTAKGAPATQHSGPAICKGAGRKPGRGRKYRALPRLSGGKTDRH